MTLFKEIDGSYSWRKILTGLTAFVFGFACIGFMFGLPEIPTSYQAIISEVFLFYFFKNTIGKMSIGSK